MSMVGNRYAKALLDLAISENAVDEYQSELIAVLKIIEADNGLPDFLLSPYRNLKDKKAVLINAFSGSVRENTLHLLLLLLDKGRIESFPDICAAYVRMADEHRNVLNITITSAQPLSKAQLDQISEKFRILHHGSSVKITEKTDSSLIGGVKVTVGDKLYDGSVKGKLAGMQSALAGL